MMQSRDDKNIEQEETPESVEATDESSRSVVDDLMFSELMKGLEETIELHFSAQKAVVYRSVSMPATQDDLKPRKLRKYESVAKAETEYEMPPLENLEDWERLNILNKHLGSSVFTNEEGLRAMWMKGFSTKKTPSDKRRYKENMGIAMVRLRLDINDGVLQNPDEESKTGHKNFLPAKGFKIEEHVDLEYGYKGYKPFLDEDKMTNDEE